MISSDFVKLKVDSDSISCDAKGGNSIIGGVLPELNLVPVIIQVVDDHCLEIDLFLNEVDLKVVQLVFPLEDPFNIVDMHS